MSHYDKAFRRKRRPAFLNPEYFCVSTAALPELRKRPRKSLHLITDFGTLLREFVELVIDGETYLADLVTGCLFCMDGSSASGSTMRIKK